MKNQTEKYTPSFIIPLVVFILLIVFLAIMVKLACLGAFAEGLPVDESLTELPEELMHDTLSDQLDSTQNETEVVVLKLAENLDEVEVLSEEPETSEDTEEEDNIAEEETIFDPLVEPEEFLPVEAYHTQRQNDVHEIAEAARDLGLDESNAIIVEAKRIWTEEQLSLNIMAKTIWFESGNAPWQHILDVGAVVKNRVDSPYWPNSVYAVVSSPNQYSIGYCSGFGGIPARYYAAAVLVMDGVYEIPKNVVYQANFRQGSGVWRESYVELGSFRSMTYFCYDIERTW